MKRFYVNVISDKVKDAAMVAERLLQYESGMMKEIRTKNDWKYNSGSGEEIYQKVIKSTLITPVFFYKTVNPWSSVLGYFDGKAIHINFRKINQLSHADLVGLLVHEKLHALGYSHGNNFKNSDKVDFSVPYYASENIKKWI
jgi:hypothetical protein